MNRKQKSVSLFGNKEIQAAFYFLLAGFLLTLFASRSSFLYPCNDWNDANSYFSMGKALFNGKMPYRDVFDQKGPYLYFLYGLAYLVSHTTFAGVYILEGIWAFLDLLGIYYIMRLYLKRNTALFLSPAVLAVIVSSKSFYWGGSAEEICFPFLVWGLYLSIEYFKNSYPGKAVSFKVLFAGGLLAGMVANIKFTVLGFFFAWMMCMAFSFLAGKDFFGAVKGCLVFLGGMAVPFVPWLVYFGWNHGLYEWYWGYVYINVFIYSDLNGEGPGLYERIYTLSKLLYWVIRDNLIYFAFLIPGVLWFICTGKKRWLERFNLTALCFFLFLGIYVGGSSLPYYALPLAVFTVFGFVLMGGMAEFFAGKLFTGAECAKSVPGEKESGGKGSFRKRMRSFAAAALALAVGAGIIWTGSMNISHMSEKKEDIFLYKFKEIVEQKENPTLLNIGCLDAGLYTVCDIVPTCRWFQTQTLAIDDVLKEQERYIREGQTDFVIARDDYPDVIWEKYELAAQEPWNQGELAFTYYLFKKM